MILIGSRALMLRASPLVIREKGHITDFDWVCTQEEFDKWLPSNFKKVGGSKVYAESDGRFNKQIVEGITNCEFELVKPGSSSDLLVKLVSEDLESLKTPFGLVPNLDILFTIKTSHRYLKNSPHFWKTLIDWHVMKKVGAKIRPEYEEFLKLREKETYNYTHPKLNVSKDSFFKDDGLKYVVVHDDIHESVKRFDKPAYLYYMKDGAEVQSSKEKFLSVPREIQLAGVVEEAATLAIERSLIPHPGVWSPEFAWKFALSKVCSSITSGWFRQFAYENALEVLKMYPEGYWEKFQKDLEEGKVRYI